MMNYRAARGSQRLMLRAHPRSETLVLRAQMFSKRGLAMRTPEGPAIRRALGQPSHSTKVC
jgi:hypothetical protein